MQNFKRLTKDDVELIFPFFEKECSLACDCSIGGTFIWADYFKTEYLIIDDTLIFKVEENGEKRSTSPPGKNIDGALSYAEADAKANGISLSFFIFDEENLKKLQERYEKSETEEKRGNFDYVYDYESLSTFKGKKLSGQRNHVNRFKRLYPDYTFEEVSEKNKEELRDFFLRFSSQSEKTSSAIEAEKKKIFELIENPSAYRQFGGILKASGDIVGFSFAEIIGNTMFVHIEKANIEYAGAYQMLVSTFASHFSREGVIYINREDDVDDEGLRKSKLSYHPLFLLKKYILRANNG